MSSKTIAEREVLTRAVRILEKSAALVPGATPYGVTLEHALRIVFSAEAARRQMPTAPAANDDERAA